MDTERTVPHEISEMSAADAVSLVSDCWTVSTGIRYGCCCTTYTPVTIILYGRRYCRFLVVGGQSWPSCEKAGSGLGIFRERTGT